MIINKSNLKAFFITLLTAFNTAFAETEPMWSEVATRVPSSTAQNDYGWLGQFPGFREWIGDRHIKDLESHDYSIKNKKFESTIAVGRDTLEDDQHGVFAVVATGMGQSAKEHPDELVYGLLGKGFSETCYDGQNFFDTDHPVGEGVVSNMQAGSGSAWFLLDTSRALKPLIYQVRKDYKFVSMTNEEDESVFMQDKFRYGVDARANVGFAFWQMAFGSKAALNEANFEAARTAMVSMKGDEGRPLNVKPTILVHGPSLSKAARDVILKKTLANGEDNTNLNRVRLVEVPWLD